MRDAVGSTWVFGLVITFTLIFTGFLVLSLAYSKAYKLKNEMTLIIEKYEGITLKSLNSESSNTGSIPIINQYLLNNGYTTMGKCTNMDGYTVYGENDLTNKDLKLDALTDYSENYYYCIYSRSVPDNSGCKTYFKVTLFYNFNLPVLGQLKKFGITGQTNEIYNAYIFSEQQRC